MVAVLLGRVGFTCTARSVATSQADLDHLEVPTAVERAGLNAALNRAKVNVIALCVIDFGRRCGVPHLLIP